MNLPGAGPGWVSGNALRVPLDAICKPCDITCAEEVCFNCGQPTTVLWRQGDQLPWDLYD